MRITIVTESFGSERRVAATPDSVKKLVGLGFEVAVESGAGTAACFTDAAYSAAGATIATDVAAHYAGADVLLKVRPPGDRPGFGDEVAALRDGATVISFLWPAKNAALVEACKAKGLTVIAMDLVPRISRAQKLDALSSMANIAGYRAIVEAAHHFGSFFCGQMTAAGKVAPAKVLVIGAGVAGLSALGAAKGLGAIVRAFDTRAAVRDQVKSMGAEFLEVQIAEDGEGGGGYAKEMSPAFIEAEMALFRAQAKEVDIVVTTALIPNRPAPKLWLADMVAAMKPGSVVVDLAAENGGNCDLTRADEVVVADGVTIIGPTDLPSRLATTASQLYAQNIVHLLSDLGGAKARDAERGDLALDFADEVVHGSVAVHRGEVRYPIAPRPQAVPVAQVAAAAPAAKEPLRQPAMVYTERAAGQPAAPTAESAKNAALTWSMVALLAVAFVALKVSPGGGGDALRLLLERITVFVLACFVGWQVIWNVTPALHTPLMSVTNAISGIILVGGLLHSHGSLTSPAVMLGLFAVLFAMINVSGGFLVTRRMLKMFRK